MNKNLSKKVAFKNCHLRETIAFIYSQIMIVKNDK